MKLYHNKITGILGITPTATSNVVRLLAKRYETYELEIIPVNEEGVVEAYTAPATGLCVVKTPLDFSGAAKLLDAEWTPVGEADRGYIFSFVVSSAGLTTAIGTSKELPLALEIVIQDGTRRRVLPSVELLVANNYWREDDPPDPVEDPYPLPGEIAKFDVPIGTNTRLSSTYGLQIRDTVTGVWRTVTFNNGDIQYTIQ